MVEKVRRRGTQPQTSTFSCPECSSPVVVGQKSCNNCGTQLKDMDIAKAPSSAPGPSQQPVSRTAHHPQAPPTTQPPSKPRTKLQPKTRTPASNRQLDQPQAQDLLTKKPPGVSDKKVLEKKKQGYWSKLDREEIRRIKIYIFAIQIIILIIIILNAMYESIIIDADKLYLSTGFYFPLGYLILLVLFLIFLLSVEGLWFKFIHLKNARSFQKRSKLIKNYQISSQWVLVSAIVIIIILLSLTFLPFIADMLKTENDFEISPNDEEDNQFEEQDAFGLTQTSSLSFDSNDSLQLDLGSKQLDKDFESKEVKYDELGNHSSKEVELSSSEFQLGYSPNKKYYFFIKNVGNNSVSGKYTINREISKSFIFNIILFMILFIITSVVWLAYLSISRKKFEQLHEEKVAELTKKYAVKPYAIDDVFLIHDDGTLISHQTRRLKPMDNDILSAMLTAIKDFIRDAFKSDSKGELNELKYGKLRVFIEHSQFAFLAVVISGTPPKDLRLRMKRALGQINRQYYNELKNFLGIPKKFQNVKEIIRKNLVSKEEEGTRFDEGSDSFWNNKGVVQTKVGKYREALNCFDKALRINPGVSNIWLNRGIALVKLSEFEEAMDCFDRALQLNPNNEAAKRRRNKCWYKWKLLEAREDYMGPSKARRRATAAARDYDYPEQRVGGMDYSAGGMGMGYDTGVGAGESMDTGIYEEPAYSAQPAPATTTTAAVTEPPPRCPTCGQPLRFVEEFETWYCDPCDSYPFDE